MSGFHASRMAVGLTVATMAVIGGFAAMTPAGAAPPTVTPSPGYDARLQEQRAAQSYYSAPVHEPAARNPRPLQRYQSKRIRAGANW